MNIEKNRNQKRRGCCACFKSTILVRKLMQRNRNQKVSMSRDLVGYSAWLDRVDDLASKMIYYMIDRVELSGIIRKMYRKPEAFKVTDLSIDMSPGLEIDKILTIGELIDEDSYSGRNQLICIYNGDGYYSGGIYRFAPKYFKGKKYEFRLIANDFDEFLEKIYDEYDLNRIRLPVSSIPKFFLDRGELEAIYRAEYVSSQRRIVHYRSIKKSPFFSMIGQKTGTYIHIGKISLDRGDVLVLEVQDSDPLKNGEIYLYGEVKGYYHEEIDSETQVDLGYYVSSGIFCGHRSCAYLLIDRYKHEKKPNHELSHCDDYEDSYRDRYGLVKVADNFDKFIVGYEFDEMLTETRYF